MGRKTKIGWCDSTWNPVVGCSRVSDGCKNCWAEAMARRFDATFRGVPWDGTILPTTTSEVPRWRKPLRIFALGMTDFCHLSMPEPYLRSIGMQMEHTHRHTYILLTKRPEMLEYAVHTMFGAHKAPKHVWIGVSVESQKYVHRIGALLDSGVTHMPIVCCEPLLGPVLLDPWIGEIAWVIAGCESGRSARACDTEWLRDIRDVCAENCTPFYLKQMEVYGRVVHDHQLDRKVWDQIPGGDR